MKARSIFIRNGGMLRTSKAIRLGVHPRTLYALRDAGEIEQVGRGLYRLASAPQLTSPDLDPDRDASSAGGRLPHFGSRSPWPNNPGSTFSRHCAPSHSQIPKIDGIPVRVFWYSEPSFSSGIDVISIDGVPVRIYSPEKTIADCFKYRNKIGIDVAIEALRNYRERKRKPDFKALSTFAKINRVERIMRPYLEAIL